MKTRQHKEEMIRFAKSEDGTEVWFRQKSGTNWDTVLKPAWAEDKIYVLNDKYAELRKKSIDEDIPIQVYNRLHSEWATPTYKLKFDADIKLYRLKPKEGEFKYPIYKRNLTAGHVVEFTSITEGVIIKDTEHSRSVYHNIGDKLDSLLPHTNIDIWEDYDYIEPTYYYRWEKLSSNNKIRVSDLISDRYAEKNEYREEGWVKRTNTKRTWEY